MKRESTLTPFTLIEADGRIQSYSEWAFELGIGVYGLIGRVRRGMTPEEAVTTPARGRSNVPNRPPRDPLVQDLDLPWEESDQSWYIVACHPDGLTLECVSQVFGLTRERIRQIEAKAFQKLLRKPERVIVLKQLLEDSIDREVRGPRWTQYEDEPGHRPGANHWTLHGRWEALEKGKKMVTVAEKITVGDESLTIAEWSEKLGLSASAIYMRIGNGWTREEACGIPKGKRPERLRGRGAGSRRRSARGNAKKQQREAPAEGLPGEPVPEPPVPEEPAPSPEEPEPSSALVPVTPSVALATIERMPFMAEYTFQLRHGIWICIRLPDDLNHDDIARLRRWLDTLPLEY